MILFEQPVSCAAVGTQSGLHFGDLFGRDADRAVQGHAGAREQRREQIALVAAGVGQEASGVDRTAAPARDDEGADSPAGACCRLPDPSPTS